MKILHGDNIVESRKALGTLTEAAIKEGIEVVRFDARITLVQARGALESGSLLGKTKLVVIENLLSSPKAKEKDKILNYLQEGKFDNDFILWEEKEIKKIPLAGAKSEVFKVNQLIFRFLDNLRPANQKETLNLLSKVKETEGAEMIFYMLVRQVRLLMMAKDNALDLPDWQKNKLRNQAEQFEEIKLKAIYAQLLEIDFAQKVSGDPFPLSSRLDLLISSI